MTYYQMLTRVVRTVYVWDGEWTQVGLAIHKGMVWEVCEVGYFSSRFTLDEVIL